MASSWHLLFRGESEALPCLLDETRRFLDREAERDGDLGERHAVKFEEQERFPGTGIEATDELLVGERHLLGRHDRRVDSILPPRQLVGLVPLPELLVVVVDGRGRYRCLERDRFHLAEPPLTPRQVLGDAEQQREQPCPNGERSRTARAVLPCPHEYLADELLGRQIVGTKIAERYVIAQLAPGGGEQLLDMRRDNGLESRAVAAQHGLPARGIRTSGMLRSSHRRCHFR